MGARIYRGTASGRSGEQRPLGKFEGSGGQRPQLENPAIGIVALYIGALHVGLLCPGAVYTYIYIGSPTYRGAIYIYIYRALYTGPPTPQAFTEESYRGTLI